MNPLPKRGSSRNKADNILGYFSYIMVAVYLSLGALLLFTDLILADLPVTQRQMLGGILLLYALYRGYSVYSKNKVKQRRYDEE